ncbi:hypothetical protein AC579_8922 [Pseudocercospora musae]|uniref:Zn(2)-C6 fungal-type domain-containing protein n=1 Tax=Pseudocercospora musae TaxID=113226 RepID=A0A139I0V2_9PEZI|nr:hypothetical protein AC579_8922 [Pseudocercospora musae]
MHIMKPRAFHSKSRSGCTTCKKRHIKCDEKKPACANCVSRGLDCPFQDSTARESTRSPAHSQTPRSTSSDASTVLSRTSDVSIIHLELYNQFIFHVCPTFTGQPLHDENYRNLIIRSGFKHHFLLNEMLGIGALSLYVSNSDQGYKEIATSFQEKAIIGLDNIITEIDSENCVAVVMFARLIGVHSFCDTFSSAAHTTFPDFLEALIGSAQMLRGVNSFMKDAMSRHIGRIIGEETLPLHALIKNANISDSSRETYTAAIKDLQRDFDEVRALDSEQRASTHTAFTWLVTSSPAYIQLSSEARPESLIILAYFCVVLHHRRGCWAIGPAGYTLLKAITSHLGR